MHDLSTRHSRTAIKIEAAIFLIALLCLSWKLAAVTTAVFALAFVFHHDKQDTPTNFGARHATWHALTALGLALPGLWVAFTR